MVPWCCRGPRAVTEETGRPLARAGHRLREPSAMPRRMFPARTRAPARKGSRQEAPRAPGARTAPRTRGEHPCSFHRLILRAVDNPAAEPDTHAGLIRNPAPARPSPRTWSCRAVSRAGPRPHVQGGELRPYPSLALEAAGRFLRRARAFAAGRSRAGRAAGASGPAARSSSSWPANSSSRTWSMSGTSPWSTSRRLVALPPNHTSSWHHRSSREQQARGRAPARRSGSVGSPTPVSSRAAGSAILTSGPTTACPDPHASHQAMVLRRLQRHHRADHARRADPARRWRIPH